MKKLFGTDGVRGTANIHPITAEVSLKLGMAAGQVFKNGSKKTRILIGKDTRASGYMIEYGITAGITAMGVEVLLVGPMPTPAIAHLTKSFAADAGIVISASHNPAKDNGIKFFDKNGYKLDQDKEQEMEELVFQNKFDTSKITGEHIGKAIRIYDASGRYIEFAKATIDNLSLKGLKIVLDCANGAAYKIAPLIFEELGAEVIVLHNTPDGFNINKNAGSLHPEIIAEEIKKNKADIGIALDGDADRVILVDEKGNIMDGDEIISIFVKERIDANKMKNKIVVTTTMSNLGFEHALNNMGVELIRTDVGDKFVARKMREIDALVGGEQSGHVIFSKYSTTGDGVISALQILKIMQQKNKKLSVLKEVMKKYPQTLVNIKVKKKIPFEKMPKVVTEIEKVTEGLGNDGRINVRYSGTENLARVMIEGKDQKEIETLARRVANVIKKEIGE